MANTILATIDKPNKMADIIPAVSYSNPKSVIVNKIKTNIDTEK